MSMIKAVPGVRHLRPYQPGKPIAELERELGICDIVKLASNENPLGPSPKVQDAICEASIDINRYPEGGAFDLKQSLSQRLKVKPQSITIGNGSDEIFTLLLRAFVLPDEQVLISQYSFAAYAIAASAQGLTVVTVPVGKEYGYDLESMLKAISKQVKIIFLANPNNPTGTWIDSLNLQEFLNQVPSDVIVVIDQAYVEYVEDPDYPDLIDWLSKFPNLVVTRTFSKVYGLAGLRIGYSLSSEEIAENLNKIRLPFNANTLAQIGAIAALQDQYHVKKSIEINQQGMKQLSSGLSNLGLSTIPSIGNFITVNCEHSGEEIYRALLKQGVIVRPLLPYGLPNHLRISVGLADENERCLLALKEVL